MQQPLMKLVIEAVNFPFVVRSAGTGQPVDWCAFPDDCRDAMCFSVLPPRLRQTWLPLIQAVSGIPVQFVWLVQDEVDGKIRKQKYVDSET